jgi:hypothetical protein
MTVAQPTASSGRPVAITVICIIMGILLVLGLIGLIGLIGVAFSAGAMGMGVGWILIYSIVNVLLTAACVYGFWMMKKWALYLYTVLFVIGLISSIAIAGISGLNIVGNLIPLVVLAVCWAYQARMT